MKKHLGNILKFLFSLALGIGLVYWSLRGVTPEQKQMIVQAFGKANYSWLWLLILFGLLSNFFRAQRWRLLLKPLGYTPNFWNTLSAVMIMFFANLAFPRLGEILRCSILAKYEKVPVEKSIGTMVLERVIDLICILILGGLILLLEYQRFYEFFAELFGGSKAEETAKPQTLKYIIFAGIAVAGSIGVYFLNKKHGLEKIISVLKEKMMGLWQGVISIKDLDRKWEFLFHTIGIWVCYILMPYFGLKCLEETANLGIVASMASVFFGGFAMVATQGGIGAFQIVTEKLLATYGVASIIGLSYGWISWSVQTFFVIIGGIASLIFLAAFNKKSSVLK
jgi:glycosyltransferase 2 family protein